MRKKYVRSLIQCHNILPNGQYQKTKKKQQNPTEKNTLHKTTQKINQFQLNFSLKISIRQYAGSKKQVIHKPDCM